ncbi:HAD-IIA family hydrolase [Variovorax sp. LjRoot175]|uniref:HAD-IIA family hydrolase n=1 Tax=Variovorax sp. LjRoot175 TaxID=3342276 RepID=UPI003ECFE248
MSIATTSNGNGAIPSAGASLARARHLIVDLDGTLIREDEPLEGAAELLTRFRDRYVIVSNNSTHTARGMARRLARMGLKVEPEHIVLAGEQTIDYMRRDHPHARMLLAASPVLQRHALSIGCELVKAQADFVVLALDPHFNRARLGTMANQLRGGARLLVTNSDDNHPGPGGTVVPETGALMAALVSASGVAPWRIIGKPGPLLLEEGLRRLGAQAASTIVIGDNPSTDALGALQLGMRCMLVGNAPQAEAKTLAALLRTDAPPQYRLSDSTSKVCRSVFTDFS